MTTLINKEIVQKRQEMAPKLEKMLESAQKLENALSEVLTSPLVRQKPAQTEKLKKSLSVLKERLKDKHRLFSNGLITVTIAGLEKSGKSTMLKGLTGVVLPTAPTRCTAVSCEIYYTDKAEDEGIELFFYTEQEVLDIINNQLKYLREEDKVWIPGREWSQEGIFTETSAFCMLNLPPVDSLLKEKYSPVLNQLLDIQKALNSYSSMMGTTRNEPMAELSKYSQHAGASDQQPLIRKIIIRKRFDGGSDNLRFCDTPGVDDPNPHARRRTLLAIKEETDFLVVMSKPDKKPSPTESFYNFTSGLRDVDYDMTLADRTMFLVNVDPAVDTDFSAGLAHIEEVKKSRIFSKYFKNGPSNVMEESVRTDFMAEINTYLRNDLPSRDAETVNRLTSEWETLRSTVRLEVLDPLRLQAPPMGETYELRLSNAFDEWFSDSSGRKPDTETFFARLTTQLASLPQDVKNEDKLKALRSKVEQILNQEEENLKSWLERNASPEQINIKRVAQPGAAVDNILPNLNHEMSRIVGNLVNVVTDISPMIQELVLSGIRNALGEEISTELCGHHASAKEQLISLRDKMAKAYDVYRDDEEVKHIVKALSEFAELSEQVGYILRHELRPALNLLSKQRWFYEHRDQLISRCVAIMPSGAKAANWLNQYKSEGKMHFPSTSDAVETQHSFLVNLAKCIFLMLKAQTHDNEVQLRELIEDYLEQASQTLSGQGVCHPGWKKCLSVYKKIILRKEYSELETKSAEAAAYRQMLTSFESVC